MAAPRSVRTAEQRRIAQVPMAHAARDGFPLVTLRIDLRGGAGADPPGKEGRAALTARMLERGTRTRTRARLADEVETLGGLFQASADREAIRLGGQVLARNLEPFADRFFEMLLEPAFDERELERARSELVAELALFREEDEALGGAFLHRAVYGANPYGRFVGGTGRDLPLLTRDDVVACWRESRTSLRTIAGVAGGIPIDRAERLLERYLGSLPAGTIDPAPPTDARPLRGVELLLVDKPERSQTQLFLGWPSLHPADPDFLPFVVANHAFGGTFTARLMQEVRVKRGWSYGAHSRFEPTRGAALGGVWTFPGRDDTVACVRLLLDLIAAFRCEGLRPDELELARGHLLHSLAFETETPEQLVGRRMHEILLGLPDDWTARTVASIESTSLDAANAAAARAVPEEGMALVLVCTADGLIGPLSDLPAVRRIDVVPFDADDPSSWREVFRR